MRCCRTFQDHRQHCSVKRPTYHWLLLQGCWYRSLYIWLMINISKNPGGPNLRKCDSCVRRRQKARSVEVKSSSPGFFSELQKHFLLDFFTATGHLVYPLLKKSILEKSKLRVIWRSYSLFKVTDRRTKCRMDVYVINQFVRGKDTWILNGFQIHRRSHMSKSVRKSSVLVCSQVNW